MAIIQVSGNVGNADYKISPQGVKTLTVSIADNRWNYREEKEETVWIRAVWFNDRADKLANSITKAKTISITGREAYKIYNGKIDRTIEPIDHKILAFKSENPSTHSQQGYGSQPQQGHYNQPHTQNRDFPYSPPPELEDDDLPF